MGFDSETEAICSEIRSILNRAVERSMEGNHVGILLSGGLDTSVIAAIASKYGRPPAYTIALKNAPASDIEYSSLVARTFGLDHSIKYLYEADIFALLPSVIKVLKTFDPMDVRNSMVIYAGLLSAKEDGITAMITGDGSDELMAGYSYFFAMDEKKMVSAQKKLWEIMYFSSVPLAESLSMNARLPFLDDDFKTFAMTLDPKFKVGTEDGRTHGKLVLRKAYEAILPPEVLWRAKTPIEHGSGSTTLPQFFALKMTDETFNEKKVFYKKTDGVTIRDKEHLAYYEIFRSELGPVQAAKDGYRCPECGSAVLEGTSFCRTCGAYPIKPPT
ncbi:MAG: asparagine synthase-related protein [Candidatus Methanomethylicus sp.]|nr:asparagine synthase-related protein [Candidatus Methanomethylicus sp.]